MKRKLRAEIIVFKISLIFKNLEHKVIYFIWTNGLRELTLLSTLLQLILMRFIRSPSGNSITDVNTMMLGRIRICSKLRPGMHPNYVITIRWLAVCDVDKHVSSIGCGTESGSLLDRSSWRIQSVSSLMLLVSPNEIACPFNRRKIEFCLKLHYTLT